MFSKSLHIFTNISGQPDWALFEHLLWNILNWMISHHCNYLIYDWVFFLIITWFFFRVFSRDTQNPFGNIFLIQFPFPKLQPCLFGGIGEIHSTIPVVAITTKLDLLPQDLVAEKAAQVSYGLWLIPTIMVVVLIILICVVIVICKRKVQHGGICYVCGL